VLFGDEEGGAAATHSCANPLNLPAGAGGTWFYEREALGSNPAIGAEDGRYIQNRQQATEGGLICTAHNYNVVPVSDRYLLTSAYYEAGTSLLDFTDVKNIEEIAYFDAAGGDLNPGSTEPNDKSDTWSSYFYRGNIFANDINRGVDVFALTGDPASLVAGARTLDRLNPQTQECLILNAQDTGNGCTAPPPGGGAGVGGGGDGGGGDGGGGDGGGGSAATPCETEIVGTKKSESLGGSAGSELISARGGRDKVNGRAGDDCLRGGNGSDKLRGGAGNDGLRTGRGKDRAKGGAGDDTITAARGGRDRINCGPGEDVAVVNARKDRTKNCENVTKRSRLDFATAAHQSH